MADKLSTDQITTGLQTLEGWEYKNDALEKDFVFKDFPATLSKMIEIGYAAEKMNHHPEWFNVYNRLNIRLRTHDADGVTSNDFDLANAIEGIV